MPPSKQSVGGRVRNGILIALTMAVSFWLGVYFAPSVKPVLEDAAGVGSKANLTLGGSQPLDGPRPPAVAVVSSHPGQELVGNAKGSDVSAFPPEFANILPACAFNVPTRPTPTHRTEKMLVSGYWRLARSKASPKAYIRSCEHLFSFAESVGRVLHFYTDMDDELVALQLAALAKKLTVVVLHHKPLNKTDLYDACSRVGEGCYLKFGSTKDHKPVLRLLSPIYHSKLSLLNETAATLCKPDQHCTHVVWVDLLKRSWVEFSVKMSLGSLSHDHVSTMRYTSTFGGTAAFTGLHAETMAAYIGMPVGMADGVYRAYKEAFFENKVGTCFDEETVLTQVFHAQPHLFTQLYRADTVQNMVIITAITTEASVQHAIDTVATIRANDVSTQTSIDIVVLYPIEEFSEVTVAAAFSCYRVIPRGVEKPQHIRTDDTVWWSRTPEGERWRAFMGFYAFDMQFYKYSCIMWVQPGYRLKNSMWPLYHLIRHSRGFSTPTGTARNPFPSMSNSSTRLFRDFPQLEHVTTWVSNDLVAFWPRPDLLNEDSVQQLFSLQRKYPSGSGIGAYITVWSMFLAKGTTVFRTIHTIDKKYLSRCTGHACGFTPHRCDRLLNLFVCPNRNGTMVEHTAFDRELDGV